MSEDEIRKMDFIEYKRATAYCWSILQTRRVDLMMRDDKAGSGRALKGRGSKLIWQHPKIKEFIENNKEDSETIKERLFNRMSYIPKFRKGKEKK